MTTMAHPSVMLFASRIVKSCETGAVLTDLPAPGITGLDLAYAVQARVFAQREGGDGRAAGWFASATNHAMRRQLGLEEPYAARWRSGRFVCAARASLTLGPFGAAIEPEVSFEFAKDLPARAEPYSVDEVLDAVAAVRPSIELVISCFDDWMNQKPLSLIAEGGSEQFLLLGDPVPDWKSLALADLPVTVTVDGAQVSSGSTGLVMDGPVSVIHWLANHARRRGEGLLAGQVCNTGMCAPVHFAKPGEEIVTDFGPLGRISLCVDPDTDTRTLPPRPVKQEE